MRVRRGEFHRHAIAVRTTCNILRDKFSRRVRLCCATQSSTSEFVPLAKARLRGGETTPQLIRESGGAPMVPVMLRRDRRVANCRGHAISSMREMRLAF